MGKFFEIMMVIKCVSACLSLAVLALSGVGYFLL
jgi:hypothetical protein